MAEDEFDASDLYDATQERLVEHEWVVTQMGALVGFGWSVCAACECLATAAPRSCPGKR